MNFKGPIVFCVISRYHGGAYVVFSRALNEKLEVAALEGTYASVIGGAPAAAVVFAGEVEARARKDPRLQALSQAMAQAEGVEKGRLRAQWDELFKIVHSEKLGELAAEFDRVHSVQRALDVGALQSHYSAREPAALSHPCGRTRYCEREELNSAKARGEPPRMREAACIRLPRVSFVMERVLVGTNRSGCASGERLAERERSGLPEQLCALPSAATTGGWDAGRRNAPWPLILNLSLLILRLFSKIEIRPAPSGRARGLFRQPTGGGHYFTQPSRRHRGLCGSDARRGDWVVIWKWSNRAATLLSPIISRSKSKR